MTRAGVLVAVLAAALAAAGCGLGAGESKEGGATVTVTRDFGTREVGTGSADTLRGGETVMRQLQRGFEVDTRYGGGFVQAINGVAGGRRGGRPVDWFFYVNGIEASEGAAARELEPGDDVWWDHHDWGATMRVPAVVGAFPEPFVSGLGGKKFAVRIGCAAGADDVCDEVEQRLKAEGVQVGGRSTPGGFGGEGLLRVQVGRWADLRKEPGHARAGEGAAGLGGLRAAVRGGRLDRPAGPAWAGRAADRRRRRARRRHRAARRGADLDHHRHGRRRARRRRGAARARRAAQPLRDRGGGRPRRAAAAGARAGGAVTYRRRASPLHAARAAVASAWCVVLAGVALTFEHPLVLAVLLLALLGAAAGARVAGPVLRALAFAAPFALVIALVNPLVVRDGLTVIARLGSVPVLGVVDVTAEATAYGGVLGLRALVVIGCFALHSAAVDPDDLLRAFRRVLVPLGPDGHARDADGPGAGPRRAPAARRAALARPGRRRRGARSCAPWRPARWIAPWTSRPRWRSAGYGAARHAAAAAPAVVAPRPRLRRAAPRSSPCSAPARWPGTGRASARTRRSPRRSTAASPPSARRWRSRVLAPFADRRGIAP